MKLEQLKQNRDTSGSFTEIFKLPKDGQVSSLIVNPGELRGNHYHERKTEHFVVVYGSARICSKNRNTNDVMTVEVSGTKPMVVTIPPNHTHNLVATGEGCVCIIWCDEQFNEKDADTIAEEV